MLYKKRVGLLLLSAILFTTIAGCYLILQRDLLYVFTGEWYDLPCDRRGPASFHIYQSTGSLAMNLDGGFPHGWSPGPAFLQIGWTPPTRTLLLNNDPTWGDGTGSLNTITSRFQLGFSNIPPDTVAPTRLDIYGYGNPFSGLKLNFRADWGSCESGDTCYEGIDFCVGEINLQPPSGQYFPRLAFMHTTSTDDWATQICLDNRGSNPVNGRLTGFSDQGVIISEENLTLPPLGRHVINFSQEIPKTNQNVGEGLAFINAFTNPEEIDYVIFESDSPHVVGYTKFFIDGTYRVAVPAAYSMNLYDIYVSHIASNDDWFTGIALLNTHAVPVTFTIDFNTGESVQLTLAGGEKRAFSIRDLFGGEAKPNIESAIIRNGEGLVGLELFGSTAGSGQNYLSGILLKDETTLSMYYPHVVSDADWWTGIVAYNPGGTNCDITVMPYQADGTALPTQNITVPANGKYIGTVSDLNLPNGTAWLEISSPCPITGFELFGTFDGNQLAGYTGVNISALTGIFPELDNDGWTGIAFVNTTDRTGTITLTAYDDTSTVIATSTISLNPKEKVVDVAENLFTQDISNATNITYASDVLVVGFQINGSTDDMLLDGLPALNPDRFFSSNLSLTSTAFVNNGPIPPQYTDDGTDVSPPLAWTGAPAKTRSFVLIVDDPDAPVGTWDHWIVYDIPPHITELAQNAGAMGGANLPAGALSGLNSWGNNYYQGPSPPAGTHRYFYTLYALSVSSLSPNGTTKAEIETAMEGNIIGQAEWIGLYTR